MLNEWASADELAAMRLPGMPSSKRAINLRSKREAWLSPDGQGTRWRRRRSRGGGLEYHLSLLPVEARIAFVMRRTPDPTAAAAAAMRMAQEQDAERMLLEAAERLGIALAAVLVELRRARGR